MHYMSIQLANKDVPHHAIHDIEAFYYVLIFVTIMFMGSDATVWFGPVLG